MTNQASELYELCKEVYERTGWDDSGEWWCYEWDDNDYRTGEKSIETDSWIWYTSNGDKKIHPAYTSDYLLEKLASDYSIEATAKYVSHDTKDSLYRYMIDKLGKFVAFTPDMPMGRYPVGDKPVIPLLKLTIALSEAGELK